MAMLARFAWPLSRQRRRVSAARVHRARAGLVKLKGGRFATESDRVGH